MTKLETLEMRTPGSPVRYWIRGRIAGKLYRFRTNGRGKMLLTREEADRLRRQLQGQIDSGRNALDVLAPFLWREGRVRADAEPLEPWKEDLQPALLAAAKRRAKKKDIPFAITAADIPIPDVCPALGVKLEPRLPGDGWDKRWNSPSIDRIDPALGYVPGNVVVISFRANALKGDATPEELRLLAEWANYCDQVAPGPAESESEPA